MSKTVLLFDFDGTIADTFESIVEIGRVLARKYLHREVSDSEVVKLRKMTPKEILSYLKVPWYFLPFVLRDGQRLIAGHITKAKVLPHMTETLKTLKKEGFTLGIVTSNSRSNVEAFLKLHNLEIFDFIEAKPTLFGKAGVIEKTLKNYAIVKETALYIGDEVRDIVACKKVGIDCASVGWGLNEEDALKAHSPTFFVKTPEQLLTVLKV